MKKITKLSNPKLEEINKAIQAGLRNDIMIPKIPKTKKTTTKKPPK